MTIVKLLLFSSGSQSDSGSLFFYRKKILLQKIFGTAQARWGRGGAACERRGGRGNGRSATLPSLDTPLHFHCLFMPIHCISPLPSGAYDGARAGRTRRAPPHRRPADGQRGTRTGCLITIGYCVCLGCRAALLFLFESTALIRSVLHQAEGEESEGNTQTTPVQNGSLRRQHIRRSPMVNSYRPPNIYEYTIAHRGLTTSRHECSLRHERP